MGTREPTIVFNNTALSGTSTVKSTPTIPAGDGEVGWTVVFTGTMTGTLSVEVSNATNQEIAINADADFQPYTEIPAIAISGASSQNIKVTQMRAFKRVRLSYTNATNSGNVTARAMGD